MGKDWEAVAAAINTRLAELDMTQIDVSKKSGVSVATLRQMQHGVSRRRSPRTLADVSEALRWPPQYLEQLADGASALPGHDRLSRLETDVADLRARLEALETGEGE